MSGVLGLTVSPGDTVRMSVSPRDGPPPASSLYSDPKVF